LPSMSDAWAAHTLRVKYAAMILAALRGDEGSDNVG
jgi:hypothetical protein